MSWTWKRFASLLSFSDMSGSHVSYNRYKSILDTFTYLYIYIYTYVSDNFCHFTSSFWSSSPISLEVFLDFFLEVFFDFFFEVFLDSSLKYFLILLQFLDSSSKIFFLSSLKYFLISSCNSAPLTLIDLFFSSYILFFFFSSTFLCFCFFIYST